MKARAAEIATSASTERSTQFNGCPVHEAQLMAASSITRLRAPYIAA
jgi:hypothetical protein